MIKFIRMSDTAIVPTRGSDGAAGYDLSSNEEIEIPAGCRALVATGISTEYADNVGARIMARSGLSVRGVDIGAGLVDSDYRGEIKALLINNGSGSLFVRQGDRIAQIVFFPIITDAIEWHGTVSETERGADGFGSTGD
jgi:dUTP pyrophosphatase